MWLSRLPGAMRQGVSLQQWGSLRGPAGAGAREHVAAARRQGPAFQRRQMIQMVYTSSAHMHQGPTHLALGKARSDREAHHTTFLCCSSSACCDGFNRDLSTHRKCFSPDLIGKAYIGV